MFLLAQFIKNVGVPTTGSDQLSSDNGYMNLPGMFHSLDTKQKTVQNHKKKGISLQKQTSSNKNEGQLLIFSCYFVPGSLIHWQEGCYWICKQGCYWIPSRVLLDFKRILHKLKTETFIQNIIIELNVKKKYKGEKKKHYIP